MMPTEQDIIVSSANTDALCGISFGQFLSCLPPELFRFTHMPKQSNTQHKPPPTLTQHVPTTVYNHYDSDKTAYTLGQGHGEVIFACVLQICSHPGSRYKNPAGLAQTCRGHLGSFFCFTQKIFSECAKNQATMR